jgi:hypothetical protein
MKESGDGRGRPKSARPGSARPGDRPQAAMPQTAAAAAGAFLAPNSPRVVAACGIRVPLFSACALAESGARLEFTGDNAAPKAASAAEVVEAKFYGDGTWNKAILGAQLGPDRQRVMFVGYEADGWQDTEAKDIRYPVKIGGLHSGGSAGDTATGEVATPTKAQDKKTKEGKGGKTGRSCKKWEVVAGFMDQATGGGPDKGHGKDAAPKASAPSAKKSTAAPPALAGEVVAVKTARASKAAPQQHPSSAPASVTATPTKHTKHGAEADGAGGSSSSDDASANKAAASAAAEEARAAVSAAAAALSGAASAEGRQAIVEDSTLGVSYDLLTALTERLDDLALFDSSQVDEEGLTAVLTTSEGAIRFIEMCRRIIERICKLEARTVAAAKNRSDIETFLIGRGWVRAGQKCMRLQSPCLRFAAMEFLVSDLQCTQMLTAAGKLANTTDKSTDKSSSSSSLAAANTTDKCSSSSSSLAETAVVSTAVTNVDGVWCVCVCVCVCVGGCVGGWVGGCACVCVCFVCVCCVCMVPCSSLYT